jgi:hypothetical protein
MREILHNLRREPFSAIARGLKAVKEEGRLALIDTVSQQVRPSGVPHRVLLTRVDARSRGEAEEARGALAGAGIPVFDGMIREYKAHRTASLLGIPISGLGLRRSRNAEGATLEA